jgi:hypothetical protein
MIAMQCQDGEEFYLNCPSDATHIINNEPVTIIPEVTTEQRLSAIRTRRNQLLASSDWTQMPDTPLTGAMKQAWAAYRQELRDFPETCDVENPVWPVMPGWNCHLTIHDNLQKQNSL